MPEHSRYGFPDETQRDTRSLGMDSGIRDRGFDPELLQVIVGNEIERQPRHAVGDISREADRLVVMVGLILMDFAIDVVRGEKGVLEGSWQLRADADVGNPVLLVLFGEKWMMVKNPHVIGLFVGDDSEGPPWLRRPITFERVEDVTEGSPDSAPFEMNFPIKFLCLHLLSWRRGPRPPSAGMAQVEHEQGVMGHGNRYLTGEILGYVETDKAINGHVFIGGGQGSELGVKGESLAAEAVETVLNGGAA